jgi:cytoskeletal protein CcmA (bactofilin family)
MASTTFSGPVTSTNGFIGSVTGAVTGAVVATTVTASGAVSMTNASISMTALPTSDPAVAGRLWNDGGTLKVSAG